MDQYVSDVLTELRQDHKNMGLMLNLQEFCRIATTWLQIIRHQSLNVRFSRKRSFRMLEIGEIERLLSATSGRRKSVGEHIL